MLKRMTFSHPLFFCSFSIRLQSQAIIGKIMPSTGKVIHEAIPTQARPPAQTP